MSRAFAVAGALAVGGCGSSTDVDTQGPCGAAAPLTAHVGPLDASVTVGNRVQLTALLRCGPDGPAVSTIWEWTSSNPSVVSVDASGLATGVSSGTATVSATSAGYQGIGGNVTVRSFVRKNAGVPTITPNALIMHPGDALQMRATVHERPNAPILWSINPTTVATIDATGVVRVPRCGVLGTAVITARNADDPTESASAALTVLNQRGGALAIQSVRDSTTGEPVDFNHAHGTIAVKLSIDSRLVECGGVSGAEFIVRPVSGNDVIVTAKLPTYPETITDVFFDTANRGANGQPRTPNGSHTIAARAFDPAGKLIEETIHQAITFDNR